MRGTVTFGAILKVRNPRFRSKRRRSSFWQGTDRGVGGTGATRCLIVYGGERLGRGCRRGAVAPRRDVKSGFLDCAKFEMDAPVRDLGGVLVGAKATAVTTRGWKLVVERSQVVGRAALDHGFSGRAAVLKAESVMAADGGRRPGQISALEIGFQCGLLILGIDLWNLNGGGSSVVVVGVEVLGTTGPIAAVGGTGAGCMRQSIAGCSIGPGQAAWPDLGPSHSGPGPSGLEGTEGGRYGP